MKESIDVNIFSPTAPLGIFIILCGLIFSGIIFYIIYTVSTDKESIDVNIFSPTAPLGIFIILCGLIFSGIIFYIIYTVSTDKESIEDKKMRSK